MYRAFPSLRSRALSVSLLFGQCSGWKPVSECTSGILEPPRPCSNNSSHHPERWGSRRGPRHRPRPGAWPAGRGGGRPSGRDHLAGGRRTTLLPVLAPLSPIGRGVAPHPAEHAFSSRGPLRMPGLVSFPSPPLAATPRTGFFTPSCAIGVTRSDMSTATRLTPALFDTFPTRKIVLFFLKLAGRAFVICGGILCGLWGVFLVRRFRVLVRGLGGVFFLIFFVGESRESIGLWERGVTVIQFWVVCVYRETVIGV